METLGVEEVDHLRLSTKFRVKFTVEEIFRRELKGTFPITEGREGRRVIPFITTP